MRSQRADALDFPAGAGAGPIGVRSSPPDVSARPRIASAPVHAALVLYVRPEMPGCTPLAARTTV